MFEVILRTGRMGLRDVAANNLPPRRRWRIHIREHLRAYFIAGILVTGPTALTVYLIWLFVTFIDHSVGALLPDQYNPQTYLHVPGIGLIVVVVGLTLIGALTAGVLGGFMSA